jgi:hypothetical protein
LRKFKDVIKRARSPLPAASEATSGAAPTELVASMGEGESTVESASDCDEEPLSLEKDLGKLNLGGMYSGVGLQRNLIST